MDMFEACRRAMGGHAFHTYSTVGRGLADSAVSTTGAGDNNVLVQQTAAFLLKQLQKPSGWSTSFLRERDRLSKLRLVKISSFQEALEKSDLILDLFKARALEGLDFAASELAKSLARGEPQHSAWNANLVHLIRAVQAYYWANVMDLGRASIREAQNAHVREAVHVLWTLVAVWRIEASYSDFALSLLDFRDVNEFRQMIRDGSAQVRKFAVVLVDAFGISDALLRAPLANSDGSSYEAYLSAVKASRLNNTSGAWPHWQRFFKERQITH